MNQTKRITGTTPAAAGQAVVGTVAGGLSDFDSVEVFADLVGATGGALDVYLQRKVASGVWVDWIHFPQLAAGAAAVRYSASSRQATGTAPVVVGKSGDAGTGGGDGAPALAANTVVPGHPGDAVRVVAVAGASTSAGAAINVYVTGVRAG